MPNNEPDVPGIPEDLRFLYEELQRGTSESRDEYGTHLTAEVGRELIERIAKLESRLETLMKPVTGREETIAQEAFDKEQCKPTSDRTRDPWKACLRAFLASRTHEGTETK